MPVRDAKARHRPPSKHIKCTQRMPKGGGGGAVTGTVIMHRNGSIARDGRAAVERGVAKGFGVLGFLFGLATCYLQLKLTLRWIMENAHSVSCNAQKAPLGGRPRINREFLKWTDREGERAGWQRKRQRGIALRVAKIYMYKVHGIW